MRPAIDWLADKIALCDSIGEKSLRNALEDASLIENKFGSENSTANETIKNVKLNLEELCKIIKNEKVN
jgi:hypothetical protein